MPAAEALAAGAKPRFCSILCDDFHGEFNFPAGSGRSEFRSHRNSRYGPANKKMAGAEAPAIVEVGQFQPRSKTSGRTGCFEALANLLYGRNLPVFVLARV
ncbi:MAG: hypothetical protein WA002_18190, partial [Candidatus Acidiferrales bacterium]